VKLPMLFRTCSVQFCAGNWVANSTKARQSPLKVASVSNFFMQIVLVGEQCPLPDKISTKPNLCHHAFNQLRESLNEREERGLGPMPNRKKHLPNIHVL
jgi:hypothetical protein